MIKLTVISGPDADNEFSFAGDVVVIGRSSQCDLMLHDAALGRRHCEIRCEDNVFLIVDLASVNGTYLNDQPERIKSERLRTGDEILLGRSRLRIELPESARQAPPRLPAETKPEGPELETTPQIPPRPSVFPGQPIAHQPTPPPHRVTPIASEKSPAAGKEPSSHNDYTIVGNASDQPSASISLRVIRGKDE
ncbi:MAG: FHA domain-containing protein, partial [Candidatus Binatia bacterium]